MYDKSWFKGKVITLCGSTKFKEEFIKAEGEILEAGGIPLGVVQYTHHDNIPITPEEKESYDNLHLQKIAKSDAILVINVDDYIGSSTRNEIKYAKHLGKGVIYRYDHSDDPKVDIKDNQQLIPRLLDELKNFAPYLDEDKVISAIHVDYPELDPSKAQFTVLPAPKIDKDFSYSDRVDSSGLMSKINLIFRVDRTTLLEYHNMLKGKETSKSESSSTTSQTNDVASSEAKRGATIKRLARSNHYHKSYKLLDTDDASVYDFNIDSSIFTDRSIYPNTCNRMIITLQTPTHSTANEIMSILSLLLDEICKGVYGIDYREIFKLANIDNPFIPNIWVSKEDNDKNNDG